MDGPNHHPPQIWGQPVSERGDRASNEDSPLFLSFFKPLGSFLSCWELALHGRFTKKGWSEGDVRGGPGSEAAQAGINLAQPSPDCHSHGNTEGPSSLHTQMPELLFPKSWEVPDWAGLARNMNYASRPSLGILGDK